METLPAMTLEPREVTTAIATLMRVKKDLLEINYHAGCVLSAAPMTEVQEARRSLMGNVPYGMLTMIPEDVDFNLDAMRTDHLQADRSMGNVVAMAIVAKAALIQKLVNIYFTYYPDFHRVLVTDREDEARRWLDAQLEEVANTGS
jgi:hypothetical protein